jgi:DNA polymerase-3 subunit delta'
MWQQILGHTEILDRFRRSAAAGRLASTYLFAGPAGIGKRTFAVQLAKSLLCEERPEAELDACDTCSACRLVAVGSHPDLLLVSKPPERSFIPLELLIGDDEHRLQEGLCHDISLKPFRGGRKVALIDDADYLNQEGANCLLKTLEEPPPKSVIILIGTSEHKQLPTIRSRCQIVRFQPLSLEQVEQLLRISGLAATDDEARELSALSGGSLEQAMQFADPSVREFRQRWLHYLGSQHESPHAFAKELSGFVDAAGKEAALRRSRLKQVARMASDYYRSVLIASQAEDLNSDLTVNLPPQARLDSRGANPVKYAEPICTCLERCIDVEAQVDANANQATLIECWLDELAQHVVR